MYRTEVAELYLESRQSFLNDFGVRKNVRRYVTPMDTVLIGNTLDPSLEMCEKWNLIPNFPTSRGPSVCACVCPSVRVFALQ